METTKLQTFSLRGIDQRWLVEPQDALNIEDMTHLEHDSWRSSGGFTQLFEPRRFTPPPRDGQPIQVDPQSGESSDGYVPGILKADKVEVLVPESKKPYSKILSLHWFAQQNGGRQWLVFEEEK